MQKRLLPLVLLIIYSAILIKVMVLRDVPLIRIGHLRFNFGGVDANGQANFVPFKTILFYLFGKKGLVIGGVNIIANIVLLVPIGFLAVFVDRKVTWKISLMLAVIAGLTIEGMQVVFRTGIFDVDDVILNGLGVMVGYWIFLFFVKWVQPYFK